MEYYAIDTHYGVNPRSPNTKFFVRFKSKKARAEWVKKRTSRVACTRQEVIEHKKYKIFDA